MPRESPGGDDAERFAPEELSALPPEALLSPLPVGRHGLPRSFVERNQRLRLVAAMVRLLPEHGYQGTTIGRLTSEAGVSRAAFYEQFDGKEACFLATYDLAGEWLCERVARAFAGEHEWPLRVRAGIAEGLRLLATNPPLAHLFAVEALQAGRAARARHRALLGRLADALRAERPGDRELPAELEELLLGGVVVMVGCYVDAGRTAELPAATGELVQYLLAPYLEPAEARRVAQAA